MFDMPPKVIGDACSGHCYYPTAVTNGTVSALQHTHTHIYIDIPQSHPHIDAKWRYCHPSLEWSSNFYQAWYCQLFFRREKGALFLYWCIAHPHSRFTTAICIKVTLQVHLLCITYCTIYICNEELYHCLRCMSVIFSKLGNWDTHFSAHTHCSVDLVSAVYICAWCI